MAPLLHFTKPRLCPAGEIAMLSINGFHLYLPSKPNRGIPCVCVVTLCGLLCLKPAEGAYRDANELIRIPFCSVGSICVERGAIEYSDRGCSSAIRLAHREALCCTAVLHFMSGLAASHCTTRLREIPVPLLEDAKQRLVPYVKGAAVNHLELFAIATRYPDVLVASGMAKPGTTALMKVEELQRFVARLCEGALQQVANEVLESSNVPAMYGGLIEELLRLHVSTLGISHPELPRAFVFAVEEAVAEEGKVLAQCDAELLKAGLIGGTAPSSNTHDARALYSLHNGDVEKIRRDLPARQTQG